MPLVIPCWQSIYAPSCSQVMAHCWLITRSWNGLLCRAVRRARPSVVHVAFGVRNKVKPFSSVLIYTDQEAANPIPTQMDTLGSYVDLEVFYQYIWQEFEKYAEYRRNTVTSSSAMVLMICWPSRRLTSLSCRKQGL